MMCTIYFRIICESEVNMGIDKKKKSGQLIMVKADDRYIQVQ